MPVLQYANPDGYTIAQLPQTIFRAPYTQKVLWDPVRDVTPIIQISGVIFGVTGLAVIVPPFIMLFFPGGAAGVFGNSTGGVRGAVLGGAITGLLLAVGQAIVTPMLSHSAPELAQLADPDWYILFLVFRPLLAPVMALFGG